MKLPEAYLRKAETIFADEYPQYLAAMNEKPVNSLRVNTARIQPEQFEKISPFALEPVPWCREGFYYDESVRPGTHPYYYAGLYYIQEASAMAPASVLPVHEGDIILDACAAPGGKSTALAAKLNHTGLLVSSDISASRQNATLKNMERFGIDNMYIIAHDLCEKTAGLTQIFDGILVDAPCSGEGMFRRDPSLISGWLNRDSSWYVPIQKDIIVHAWDLLKPGGCMVYSTCTFSKEENEDVIGYLADQRNDVIFEKSELSPFFEHGLGIDSCMRLYPHRIKGEGHFVCLLRKKGERTPSRLKKAEKQQISNRGFHEFMKSVSGFSDACWMMKNDRIYRLPEQQIDTSDLRVIRSGLYMGSVKNDRFEPSQALAFTLDADTFENTVSYSADDIRTEKYLRGETIRDESCTDGWVLVTAEGYPLGFGKCQGHMIKNRLEKGYRKL